MKYLITLIALFMLSGNPVQAQGMGPHMQVLCESCRNPAFYPRDYRNFAYNQVFGDMSWMTVGMADFFYVTNMNGQTVSIDMNMDYTGIGIDVFGFFLTPYPTGLTVQVIVGLDNGDQISYTMDPRAISRVLPVGGRRGSRGGGGPGGGGGGTPSGPPPDPLPGNTPRCGYTQVDDGERRRTCW